MLDSLEKQHQKNAATTLRERIAQCEAADILATKDFPSLNAENVRKLLTLTRKFWSQFPLYLKLKVAEFNMMTNIIPSLGSSLKTTKSDDITKCGLQVADALRLEPTSANINKDMLQISYNDVFQEFLKGLEYKLKELGMWKAEDGTASADEDEDLTTKFGAEQDVVVATSAQKPPAVHPDLALFLELSEVHFLG